MGSMPSCLSAENASLYAACLLPQPFIVGLISPGHRDSEHELHISFIVLRTGYENSVHIDGGIH